MKLIIVFLLLSQGFIALSQENTENDYFKIGLSYEFNNNFIENDQLNDFLLRNNYFTNLNEISNTTIGISLRSIHSSSQIHIGFNSGKSLTEKEDKTIISSYGLSVDYLYDFIKSDNWLVAPAFGFNLNNYKLTTIAKNTNSLLSNMPLEETFQMNNKALINLGLQLNRKINISFVDVFLGLKAGYTLNLGSENWYNTEQQKLNIPSIKLSGLYWCLSSVFELNLSKVKNLKL